MTNPAGDSSETPPSDAGSGSSEPISGGYEAPPIEQSQQGDGPAQQQPATEQVTPPAAPTERFVPPGYAPPSGGYEPPSSYPPPSYQQPSYPPSDYQQGGYPPAYPPSPAYPPPPPGYPTPGVQQPGSGQPGYPPPYPDPSALGGQQNYGPASYPPPPPSYGGAPGYPPPPSSYPATGYPGGYGGGYGQPQPETNQLAIWSLVASLIGILCTVGSFVGIGLGVVALNQIKERRQGGHGLAIAGIAVGVATLIIGVIWWVFALSS
ncbi:hypothetical protein A5662_19720 [Mycobacteriaceae bacterium 1482268.1]|nr:hypothetical protein A5662_19720 [Mycobacteriaceae bacterium 1482268.1]